MPGIFLSCTMLLPASAEEMCPSISDLFLPSRSGAIGMVDLLVLLFWVSTSLIRWTNPEQLL